MFGTVESSEELGLVWSLVIKKMLGNVALQDSTNIYPFLLEKNKSDCPCNEEIDRVHDEHAYNYDRAYLSCFLDIKAKNELVSRHCGELG